MGMKLAQANASAGSIPALMPGAPESQPPRQTFSLGPWRVTHVSPHVVLPRSISKYQRRDSSLELTVSLLATLLQHGNGNRNATLAIGVGDKVRAELESACCY